MLRGRYKGITNHYRLDLRVDIGTVAAMNRISGDIFTIDTSQNETFLASFITPRAVMSHVVTADTIIATDIISLANPDYGGGHLRITQSRDNTFSIDLNLSRPADATTHNWVFNLQRTCDEMRDIRINTYVTPNLLPPDSPALQPVHEPGNGAAGPVVTLSSALRQTGIRVEISPSVSLPLEVSGQDEAWSDAELHQALQELHVDNASINGQQWPLNLLITTRSDRPRVLGVMFETGAQDMGRAAAIFYKAIEEHDKVAHQPEAFAREYLFTCAHEIGHMLGLPHAWEPLGSVGSPERSRSTLTFMAYPHLYTRGYRRFYRAFHFRYREEERLHIDHAAWPAICPARASAFSGTDALLMGPLAGFPNPVPVTKEAHSSTTLGLELRATGESRYQFAEPIHLEVKLVNRSRQRTFIPGDALDAEGGRLSIYIKHLNGSKRYQAFHPIILRELRDHGMFLTPKQDHTGRSMYASYNTVDITVGKSGFTFSEPGRYEVRAATRLLDNRPVWSKPITIEIAAPDARLASISHDLFSPAIGRALMFGGDPEGAELARLREIVESGEPRGLVPWAALRLGESMARSFKRINRKGTVSAKPQQACFWLEKALLGEKDFKTFPNILRSNLLKLRASCYAHSGLRDKASNSLKELRSFIQETVPTNLKLQNKLISEARRLQTRLSIEN